MKRFGIILFLAVILFLALKNTSLSIPAFARKYKTSCATCHNGFPKLNAFGEAFRRNGYQFPDHGDAEAIKEEPVSLGAEGNKKAFPDAIWPGTLPGSSPISLFFNGEMDYNPKVDPRFTFDGLGSSIEAVAAGTFGEDLSFWGHLIVNGDGTVELNRIFLIFSNIVGDSYAFNARIGVIEPGLFSFSTHRAWLEGYWMTTRAFSNDMGWSIEETQKGIELNGMAAGRFGWNAGIVEGFGAPHSDKDYYGHVTYKFGGLPLDGVVEPGAAPNNAKPYFDNSVTVGAFAYMGTATLGPDSAQQDNAFSMVGADVNAYYDQFNLFGGVGIRHDDRPFIGDPLLQSANTTVWFTELDMTVFPWLMPGLRFESWNSHTLNPVNGSTVAFTDMQFVPGITFLVRPNVKFTLRTMITKFDSQMDTKWQLGQVALALAVGI